MALSCDAGGGHPDMDAIARHAVELATRIDWKKVAHRRVINVNYPRGPLSEAKGLRICPQTSAVWKNAYADLPHLLARQREEFLAYEASFEEAR